MNQYYCNYVSKVTLHLIASRKDIGYRLPSNLEKTLKSSTHADAGIFLSRCWMLMYCWFTGVNESAVEISDPTACGESERMDCQHDIVLRSAVGERDVLDDGRRRMASLYSNRYSIENVNGYRNRNIKC